MNTEFPNGIRFNPTGFQPVSFQQVRSDRLLRITEHVGIVGTTRLAMNDYRSQAARFATVSRARRLPPFRR